VTGLHGRPSAAELVAAAAEFLETDVGAATTGQVNFHARVAANALRIVERELLDTDEPGTRAALAGLGFADEAGLAAAIRAGEFDGSSHHPEGPEAREAEVTRCLRTLVRHRLAVAHPGYDSG
jgi:hypothetical protein